MAAWRNGLRAGFKSRYPKGYVGSSPTAATMLLFVYGTLKEGYHNNHYLEDQTLIGEVETKPYYRLFCNDTFPMMIRDRRNGYSVRGEIWEVDEEIIDEIDRHEVLYNREIISVNKGYKNVYAYLYQENVYDCMECYGEWP